jgi:hypothetical protein
MGGAGVAGMGFKLTDCGGLIISGMNVVTTSTAILGWRYER